MEYFYNNSLISDIFTGNILVWDILAGYILVWTFWLLIFWLLIFWHAFLICVWNFDTPHQMPVASWVAKHSFFHQKINFFRSGNFRPRVRSWVTGILVRFPTRSSSGPSSSTRRVPASPSPPTTPTRFKFSSCNDDERPKMARRQFHWWHFPYRQFLEPRARLIKIQPVFCRQQDMDSNPL